MLSACEANTYGMVVCNGDLAKWRQATLNSSMSKHTFSPLFFDHHRLKFDTHASKRMSRMISSTSVMVFSDRPNSDLPVFRKWAISPAKNGQSPTPGTPTKAAPGNSLHRASTSPFQSVGPKFSSCQISSHLLFFVFFLCCYSVLLYNTKKRVTSLLLW